MKIKTEYVDIPVDEARNIVHSGDPDYAESIYLIGLINPISLSYEDGKYTVIAGHRRLASAIKAYDMCVEAEEPLANERRDLSVITAKVWHAPYDSVKHYGLIENEHRSPNLIHAFLLIKKLEKEKRWAEVNTVLKLNKATENKIRTLSNLKSPDHFIRAFQGGQVTANTLFAIAKLDGQRQKFLLNVLKTKNKLTGRDIREVKTEIAHNVIQGAMAKMDFDRASTVAVSTEERLYALLINDKLEGPFTLVEALPKKTNGAVLYMLQKV